MIIFLIKIPWINEFIFEQFQYEIFLNDWNLNLISFGFKELIGSKKVKNAKRQEKNKKYFEFSLFSDNFSMIVFIIHRWAIRQVSLFNQAQFYEIRKINLPVKDQSKKYKAPIWKSISITLSLYLSISKKCLMMKYFIPFNIRDGIRN